MSPSVFAEFAVCLQFLPAPQQQPWSALVARFYLSMLEPVPDGDAAMLAKAIGQTRTFRPLPAEILDTWRSMRADDTSETVARIMAEIYNARDAFGEYGTQDPQRPGVWRLGAPPFNDPRCLEAVQNLGGWVEFARSDSPHGVLHAQLKVAVEAVVRRGGNETLAALRLEYRERNGMQQLSTSADQPHA